MTCAFSWQNFISLCPAFFCTPRPNLPVIPGISWLPTFAFQSPIMKRTAYEVTAPFSWVLGFVCSLQESVSQSCVCSGGSMVGLMVTSSKRAFATPRSAAPRAPAPAAAYCWPIPPRRHSNRVLYQSLWGLWVLMHIRFVWALWASMAGMGF